MTVKERYEAAKVRYAELGIDTDKAIEILKTVPISLHCWQGDDVKGFDRMARLQAVSRPQETIREKQELRKN